MPDRDGTGPRRTGKLRRRSKDGRCRNDPRQSPLSRMDTDSNPMLKQPGQSESSGSTLKSVAMALVGLTSALLPVIGKIDRLLTAHEKKKELEYKKKEDDNVIEVVDESTENQK